MGQLDGVPMKAKLFCSLFCSLICSGAVLLMIHGPKAQAEDRVARPVLAPEPALMAAPVSASAPPTSPDQIEKLMAQPNPLLADLSVGVNLAIGSDFTAKLRKAGLANKSGEGATLVALFQVSDNRWNKTRLDFSKPYCLVYLKRLSPPPKARLLPIANVQKVREFPAGFAGVYLQIKDDEFIDGLGCFRADLAGKVKPSPGLTLLDLKEAIGIKMSLAKGS